MEFILKEKIRLGISACNFGSQVRWNHIGWDRLVSLEREKNDYIWVPVCPEILSGFGTPRPPIKLSLGNGDDLWNGNARMKNRLGRNVSEEMKKGAMLALDIIKRSQVDGFVFMEGSPSCGVYRTTLKEKRLGRPPGVFGSLLLKEDLFLIPALDLESPWKWWDWSRRLHAFAWLKKQEIKNSKDLYDIWHALKFMCQEAHEKTARDIGTWIANGPKKPDEAFFLKFKRSVFELLRQPSTLSKISNALTKHYAHYRKHFGLKAKDLVVPEAEQGKRLFIKKLREMERKAFEQTYSFSGHPVIYRLPNR